MLIISQVYLKKITVTGEENIKFTDVGEAFDTYTSRRFCYLVADNGNVYKGNGATFTKLDGVTDAESICMAYIGDVPTIKKTLNHCNINKK